MLQLNPQQALAVAHNEGPMLVLAGAGSGKTRVITRRFSRLVREGHAGSRSIVAVTFTNRAAREMRERIAEELGDMDLRSVSTFHSSCARWMRFWPHQFGLRSGFSIYDDADRLSLVRHLCRELSLPHDMAAGRDFVRRIEANKQRAARIVDVQQEARGNDAEAFAELFECYQHELLRANALDFGDLIARTVHTLEDNSDFRSMIRGRISHLMVDEFQDTNEAQFRLVQLLAGDSENVVAVGDDDQAIYAWRGATVENVQRFIREFTDVTTVALETNYRSQPPILGAAHCVVERLPDRLPKKMRAHREGTTPVQVFIAADEREEADFAARTLLGLREELGVRWDDCAIFYRTNAQSRVFEERLRGAGVPHRVVGATSFFERREVRDLIAWMRVVVNPDDNTSFRRIVNVPTRGVGKGTLDRMEAFAATGLSLVESIPQFLSTATRLNRRTRAGLKKLGEILDDARAEAGDATAHELLTMILERTGYLSWIAETDRENADDRILNVDSLLLAAREFAEEGEDRSVAAFLEYASLRHETDDDGDGVQLMTVHTAKGLEFARVIVTGLEKGLFPLERRHGSAADVAEERRLLYVAMTRAKDGLTLSAARSRRLYGRSSPTNASPFLAELPTELLTFAPESSTTDLSWTDRPQPSAAWQQHRAASEWDEFDQRPLHERRDQDSEGSAVPGPAVEVPDDGVVFDDAYYPDAAQRSAAAYVGRFAEHKLFGAGKIVDADRTGERVRLTIDFPEVGEKKVILKYVTLLD